MDFESAARARLQNLGAGVFGPLVLAIVAGGHFGWEQALVLSAAAGGLYLLHRQARADLQRPALAPTRKETDVNAFFQRILETVKPFVSLYFEGALAKDAAADPTCQAIKARAKDGMSAAEAQALMDEYLQAGAAAAIAKI